MQGVGDAIRLELMRGAGATPLRVVSDGGNTARLLLAQVTSGVGALLEVVVKVGRDLPRVPLAGTEITQAQAAARQAREAVALDALGGCAGVVQRLPVEGQSLLGETGMAVLCAQQWIRFAPVCPRCGAALVGCTDGSLLDRLSLPLPGASRHAFLACPACGPGGPSPLYTLALPKEVRGAGTVVDFGGWRDRLGAALASLPEGVAPCVGCAEATVCFPATGAGQAANRLLPIAFAPVAALALEPLHLRFDEHMALLGGEAWDSLVARALTGEGQAARRGLVEVAAASMRRAPQYLFEGETSGLFQLEVLYLKAAAFLQLLGGVAALHERLRAPHLRLDPSHVMARLAAPGGPAPARWTTAVRLIAPGGAAPMAVDGLPTGLFLPPAEVREAYSAPPVVAPSGRGERVEVELVAAAKGRFQAVVRGGPLQAVVNDGLTLQVAGEVALFGRIERVDGNALQVSGSLTAGQEEVVAGRVGERLAEAACLHHPTLHVPCDLFSLGRLWLHGLLVNDTVAVAVAVAVIGPPPRRAVPPAARRSPSRSSGPPPSPMARYRARRSTCRAGSGRSPWRCRSSPRISPASATRWR